MRKRLTFLIWLVTSAICCLGVPLLIGPDRFGYVGSVQAGWMLNWFGLLSLIWFIVGAIYWIVFWRRSSSGA